MGKRMLVKKYKRIFVLVLFIIMGSWIHAQQQALLYYLVRQPVVKTNRPPLLILLHGYGSNETDLFSLAEKLKSVRRIYPGFSKLKACPLLTVLEK